MNKIIALTFLGLSFSSTLMAQEAGLSATQKFINTDSISVEASAQKNEPPTGTPTPKSIPVPVETLVGSRGIYLTSTVNKQISSIPNLGFFSVYSLVKEWETDKIDDLMIQAHLTYRIYKGFSAVAGFHYTSASNFRPTAGFMYSYANPDWTIVLFPRIDLTDKPNTEIFGFVEYKPRINDKFRFYSRIQGMYVHNLSYETHEKSGFNLRAGLAYKEFAFGAGFNSDYYSPAKINKTNLGLFVSFALF